MRRLIVILGLFLLLITMTIGCGRKAPPKIPTEGSFFRLISIK